MVDWLKLLHTFPRNPKLRLLARRLKCHKLTAQGLAVQWLIFVDEQTTDGCTHLTVEEMDNELGFRGGAAALCDIGWASLDGEGCLVASEFGKHCGDSAKKRAEEARRKSVRREKCPAKNGTNVPEKTGQMSAKNGTNVPKKAGAEEEEEKEEKERLSYESLKKDAPTLDQVVLTMAQLMLKPLHGDALTECATRFLDDMEATGWLTPKGLTITDWAAAARNYARRYAENTAKRAIAVSKGNNPKQRKDCNNADDYR